MAVSQRSSSRKLTDYPRPSVAVDVAVLTVIDDALHVVVVEHARSGRALPGTFLHEGETLADAASRALQEKAHLERVDFAQLHVFDDPARDDRGWVLSVGHSAALPAHRLPASAAVLPVVDKRVAEPLLFDHEEIVHRAVERMQVDYARAIDPANLLGPTFTVLQLRRLYEAVYGHRLMKDTFRRMVEPSLVATGEMGSDFGRPARVFRRGPDPALPAKAWATLVGSNQPR